MADIMKFLVDLARPEVPDLKSVNQAPGDVGIWDRVLDAINLGGSTAMLGTVGPKNLGKAGVMAGMKHAGSAASPEAFSRLAAGTRFFKVNRAGKVTPMLDVASVDNIGRLPAGEAIVRVSPNGERVVEGGQVAGKAMQDALEGLTPGKARSGLHGPATDIGDEGVEDAMEFLRSLGVDF